MVCNSLKPPVGKGTMVYKVLLSEVAERCWCVQGVLLVPPSIPEEDTHFHEPSELCARTAYHCSSSQNSSTPHHPSAHSLLQRTQRERRMPCPPEKFPLTPHKHYCFLSEMCRTKHSLCFKVVKLASKEKMQSISRERKHSPGILLHMNWIKKRSLWCITFAACGESFHLKDRKAVPLGIIHILSIPQGCHALQPCMHLVSNSQGLPLGFQKLYFRERTLIAFS